MNADDGSDEHESSDDDENREDSCDELKDEFHVDIASDGSRTSEVGALSGWPEFISSAEGIRRYMEEAAARLSDASILVTPPSPVCTASRGDAAKQGEEGVQRASALLSEVTSTAEYGTGAVGASVDSPAAPGGLADADCTRLGVSTLEEKSTPSTSVLTRDRPHAECSRTAIGDDDSITCIDGAVAPVIKHEHEHATTLDSSITGHDTIPHEAEVLSGERWCWAVPKGAAEPQLVSPSTATSRSENDSRKNQHQTSSAIGTFNRGDQILPVGKSKCLPLAVKQRYSVKPLMEESCFENRTSLAAATSVPPLASDLPWLLKAFESASAKSIGHENEMAKHMREVCENADEGVDTGVGGYVAQDHVVASVAEVQISQRIERDKERALRARRNKWCHELQR